MALVRGTAVEHHSQHTVLLLHEENANGSANDMSVHDQPLLPEGINEFSTVGKGVLETSIPMRSNWVVPAAFRGRETDVLGWVM